MVSPRFLLSVFTGWSGGVLTKQITLRNGKINSATPVSGCGQVQTVSTTLDDLAVSLTKFQKNQCLVHGIAKHGVAVDGPVPVGTAEYPVAGGIERSLKYLEYPDGPGLGMLDIDQRDELVVPHDEVLHIIEGIFPQMRDAAIVTSLSTSTEIYDTDGTRLSREVPGAHLYFAALDARDLPRFGKVLFKRLWLVGYGIGELSNTGAFLKRGAIDAAVFSPERCDFVAGAVLRGGLVQRRPAPTYRPGGYLDTRLLPDLTATQEAEFERRVAAERAHLKPLQEPKRSAYAEKRSAETGESMEAIHRRLAAAQHGTIDADIVLKVKSTGGRLSIRAMVALGFDKAYIEDPTETTDTWARLHIDGPGEVRVLSFLHGWSWLRVTGLSPYDFGEGIPPYPAPTGSVEDAREAVAVAFSDFKRTLLSCP